MQRRLQIDLINQVRLTVQMSNQNLWLENCLLSVNTKWFSLRPGKSSKGTYNQLQDCLMVILSALIASLSFSPPLGDHVPLTLIPSGGVGRTSRFMPVPLTLSAKKPACAKKIPALTKPSYGVIVFQNRDHAVIVDDLRTSFKLYLDSNGNGDLTDEMPVDWKSSKYKGKDGKEYTLFRGTAKIELIMNGVRNSVDLGVYQFDKSDPANEDRAASFYYYSDYVAEGSITLDGKAYHCYLMDWEATGFIPDLERNKKGEIINSGLKIAIDVNGNGRIEDRGERFGAFETFNVAGTSYELTKVSNTGFDYERSSTKVKKVPLPPVVGDKIPNFTVKPISGKPYQFQGPYKKKLVMVFFWSMGEPYSINELPGLASTYQKFHSQGFDILGVNTDQPEQAKSLPQFIVDHKMTWPEISEVRRINEDVINLFVVEYLPQGFLIDGDTGVVLATIDSLRGDKLAPTIERALAIKKAKG